MFFSRVVWAREQAASMQRLLTTKGTTSRLTTKAEGKSASSVLTECVVPTYVAVVFVDV